MRTRNAGFALVIVLVTTAGIFALATQAGVASRAATVESRVAIERASARRGGRAAVGLVVLGLASAEHNGKSAGAGIGSLFSSGGNKREAAPSVELPAIIKELLGSFSNDLEEGARKTPAGRGSATQRQQSYMGGLYLPDRWIEVALPNDRHVYRVRLTDATGQLNVNHVNAAQFRSYLTLKGVEPSQASSIADELLDWIDEDRFVRARGAEQLRHQARGVVCANRPMRLRREMLYLPSMTSEIFSRIRDDLSVGGDGKLHVGSASLETLLTLDGMNRMIAGRIIERRRLGPITQDDLEDLLPLAARDSLDQLRVASGSVLRVRVEALEPGRSFGLQFEGLLIVGAGGRVRSLHLHDRAADVAVGIDRDREWETP